MDQASSASPGRDNIRSSHFDDQRANSSSLRSSHSRDNSLPASQSRAGSEDNPSEPYAGAVSSSAPGTAHNSWTPLQQAASRHDAANRHRRHASSSSGATQTSKHHSGKTQQVRQRSNTGDAAQLGKRTHSSQIEPSRQYQGFAGPSSQADAYDMPSDYDNLDDAAAPAPVIRGGQRRLWRPDSLEAELGQTSRGRGGDDEPFENEEDLTELSALPPVVPHSRDRSSKSRSGKPSRQRRESHPASHGSSSSGRNPKPHIKSTADQQPDRASRFATQLYTISYLIFFAILGTLARLGVQWLTFYPGAPVVFSVLWANVGGSLVMGFLAEDRQLFSEEWGTPAFFPSRSDDEEMVKMMVEAKTAHGKVKKTIPLYVGLATGFCGSFTSFSSFIRDVFLALSNGLPSPFNHPYPSDATRPSYSSTVPHNGGYSFMSLLAVIIITVGLCLSAYTFGAHLALALDPITPTLPFRLTRRAFDRAIVPIAWLAWLGAIIMTIWPPAETWRGQALFACVFAPLGCLTRFYASLKLNGLAPSFPLGTFAVNVFGTAVLGMAYDLQHVPLDTDAMGGGRVGCQVLEGVMDGFCGCLTTVSTWVAELRGLRLRHAYAYGVVSMLVGLGTLVVVMGSVKWTVEFGSTACMTTRWS